MAPSSDLSGSLANGANRDGSPDASPDGRLTSAPAGGIVSTHTTHLNPKFGPEETVPGLECSYGSFAYSYASPPYESAQQSRRTGCHNPVERPEERHHCDCCGGDYCDVHADPAAHDCENVITCP